MVTLGAGVFVDAVTVEVAGVTLHPVASANTGSSGKSEKLFETFIFSSPQLLRDAAWASWVRLLGFLKPDEEIT